MHEVLDRFALFCCFVRLSQGNRHLGGASQWRLGRPHATCSPLSLCRRGTLLQKQKRHNPKNYRWPAHDNVQDPATGAHSWTMDALPPERGLISTVLTLYNTIFLCCMPEPKILFLVYLFGPGQVCFLCLGICIPCQIEWWSFGHAVHNTLPVVYRLAFDSTFTMPSSGSSLPARIRQLASSALTQAPFTEHRSQHW